LALIGRGDATALAAHVPDRPAEAPDGPTVLGPDAVATLLAGRRSAFGVDLALDPSGLDQRVAPPGVTIADDHAHLPHRFDAEGTPRRRVVLVRDGILVNGVHDASSAPSTGHATLALTLAPRADHLVLTGGAAPGIDALIAEAGAGVYVPALTRRNGDLHTRGAAAIDGGRIIGTVPDHLFRCRGTIRAMTAATRPSPAGDAAFLVPAVLLA
jgi:predicted Zn-dependent protease